MDLSEAQIKLVEDFAGNFFSPGEIAIIMSLNSDEVKVSMADNSVFKNAFYKGKLISEAQLRQTIFDLAKKGSVPAQLLAVQIISKSYLNEIEI